MWMQKCFPLRHTVRPKRKTRRIRKGEKKLVMPARGRGREVKLGPSVGREKKGEPRKVAR